MTKTLTQLYHNPAQLHKYSFGILGKKEKKSFSKGISKILSS